MWMQKKENGRFQFFERYEDYVTGKQKTVSVTLDKNTTASRKQARSLLDEKIRQKNLVQPDRGITLHELIEKYNDSNAGILKEQTRIQNMYIFRSLERILDKDALVNRLTAPYIIGRVESESDRACTRNERMKHIKLLLRWGYKNDLVNDVGFLAKLPTYKDDLKARISDKYMEKEELASVLAEMKNARYLNLTKFLVLSGLRIGEYLALDDRDIDYENRVIHVTKTVALLTGEITDPKNFSSIRDVYMQDELLDVRPPRNVDYYAYKEYLARITKKVLGRRLTPHALRHTHTSLLAEAGVPLEVISRRLGHENSKVTREIYLHVTKEMKRRDNDALKDVKLVKMIDF